MKENQTIEEPSSEFGLDKEMNKYILLARMAEKRKKVVCPDSEQAWQALKKAKEAQSVANKRKTEAWRIWGVALIGAAAMLAGIILFNYLFPTGNEGTEAVVAMRYDETPQSITLQNKDRLVDLSNKDSISFLASVAKGTVTQDISPEQAVSQRPSSVTKTQKLSTPRGMDFKVILPDGSEVWLNAESTIEFPAAFSGKERNVTLKGEAYFKVARNEQSPFIVTSDKITVRVLGTEFNFKSYASETTHVSLVKGSVEVLHPNREQPEIKLVPGQDAWCDETGTINVRKIDIYAVTQWVNGFFYFDNLPLVEILRELGRWYNLGVIFRNPAYMHYKIHFSASRNEDIHQAVENLNRLRKVQVKIEDTNLVIY